MDTDITRISVYQTEHKIQIMIYYENYAGRLPEMVNRSHNVSDYFKKHYDVRPKNVSHIGNDVITLYLPVDRIDAAAAFKLEFG